MRAGMAAMLVSGMVAPATGKTPLHRRGTHAGKIHKHDENGNQSV